MFVSCLIAVMNQFGFSPVNPTQSTAVSTDWNWGERVFFFVTVTEYETWYALILWIRKKISPTNRYCIYGKFWCVSLWYLWKWMFNSLLRSSSISQDCNRRLYISFIFLSLFWQLIVYLKCSFHWVKVTAN